MERDNKVSHQNIKRKIKNIYALIDHRPNKLTFWVKIQQYSQQLMSEPGLRE